MEWWSSGGEHALSGEILIWEYPHRVKASTIEICFTASNEHTTCVEIITWSAERWWKQKRSGNAMHNPRTMLKSTQEVQNGGVMAKERKQKTLDERQMEFLKTLAHGLRTGAISSNAYAKVRRVAVGDGDSEYYTIWNGVGRSSQKLLNEMTLEDLRLFAEQGRLSNINDEQFQVRSEFILSAVKEF
jgi:hypothetical protein